MQETSIYTGQWPANSIVSLLMSKVYQAAVHPELCGCLWTPGSYDILTVEIVCGVYRFAYLGMVSDDPCLPLKNPNFSSLL